LAEKKEKQKGKCNSKKKTHCPEMINTTVFTHAKTTNCIQPTASYFHQFSSVQIGTISKKM